MSIHWEPHQWYNDYARLECGRSWVRAPIGSNQRLEFVASPLLNSDAINDAYFGEYKL
jgi:hypothetical protein